MRKPAATSHRGVTRQAVAEAAADLVAMDGLEALSVRQVANRLGVWPTTVMHHAGGRREGLLALLIEHLAAGIRTELHGSWRARLAELGREIRRVALAHRGLADVLLRSGATGPQALRLADAILDALQDAGLDQDDAQDAYDLFLTYVLGSAGRQTTATAPARWRAFERRLTKPSPTPTPRSGAPLGAAQPVTTTRASPAASTSSSMPSLVAPRASWRPALCLSLGASPANRGAAEVCAVADRDGRATLRRHG